MRFTGLAALATFALCLRLFATGRRMSGDGALPACPLLRLIGAGRLSGDPVGSGASERQGLAGSGHPARQRERASAVAASVTELVDVSLQRSLGTGCGVHRQ